MIRILGKEEIRESIKKDEKQQYIAGVIVVFLLLAAVVFYTSDENRHEVWSDEIDDPCIAYNC